MILVVCVDDRYGMRFNNRRQSSDRAITDKILELLEGKRIWMEHYSESLFPGSSQLCIDNDFLQRASLGDYCFVERFDVEGYLNRAEKIVLFCWNRKYPADLYFPQYLLTNDWRLVETLDFTGTSHEKITMKVYES